MLTSNVSVIEGTTRGTVIHIEVRGEFTDGDGKELTEIVKRELSAHNPRAFVIDVLQTTGHLRADTLGGLLPEFVRKPGDSRLYSSFVAKGGNARGIRWFLEASKVGEMVDIPIFSDTESAVDYLNDQVRGDVSDFK